MMDTSNVKEVFESPKVKELTAQVAALELEVVRLRNALETFIAEHEECEDSDGWMAQMCSMEALHAADEAMSTPFTPTALSAMIAKVAELEADLEFQTNARIQDRKDAETNYKNWNAELKKQLAAAQEDNQKLRIALDSTKRDLIRMRCPDFFEGVRDGYEFSFDNHLVNMIGLINDYTKQE